MDKIIKLSSWPDGLPLRVRQDAVACARQLPESGEVTQRTVVYIRNDQFLVKETPDVIFDNLEEE